MARGVSTVLDVAVCLLLVGAAMTTLTVGIPNGGRHTVGDSTTPDADVPARTLATVTADVSAPRNRTVHGTLADHLGRAAVANTSLDGDSLSDGEYAGAVATETAETTGRRVAVTARWEPYPGAPLRGTVTAGRMPPTDADVAVTRHVVATGIDASMADPDSFGTLARALATAYVEWRFPPERTRAALVDERTAPATADRYRTAAAPLGADIEGALAEADTRRTNELLANALANRLEADLRERYDTPAAAAEASAPDRTVLVVRRWDR
ncbi:hypothetical protein HWV23_11350 [Natronomonas halophila]|uniref:DUF7284 family protein n=1 Tax=Natronomonas halophila TaxID=2747817 RepID=UPI0015B5106C|nr:hypothetical protein [Natronomonas halophila]QLD86293.1 hypothetical protein HWV23_11350 [Natronomonas halophila]